MYFSGKRTAWRPTRTKILRTTGALVALFALAACGSGGGDGASIDDISLTDGSSPPLQCPPGSTCRSSNITPSPQDVTCKGLNNEDVIVHPKTIAIHNNSGQETIYPVLATSANSTNEWLQGCFRSNEPYPTTSVYKLYVNQGRGIPPNSSVTITLPLYSKLSNGNYITWWNGGRVVLADRNERLLSEKEDSPLTTPAEVTCKGQATTCQLSTYSSKVQFPENIYAQLSEYTFGDSIRPAGANQPRYLKPENVGYNISYVDHVYMPVAIGPKGNPYIGYNGSAQPLTTFRSNLQGFLSDIGEGWPVYNLEELKLPGGYNIFAQRPGTLPPDDNVPVKPVPPESPFPPVLTVKKCIDGLCTNEEKASLRYGIAVQRMQTLWGSCVDWGTEDTSAYFTPKPGNWCPKELKDKLTVIKRFFHENHQKYLAMHNNPSSPCKGKPQIPTFNFWEAITHIYGWVPFNEGCGADVNPLSQTVVNAPDLYPAQPKWDHARTQEMYIHELQYNYKPGRSGEADPEKLFNPYVQLIHENLKMNAYGFSVDDAVGFMSELGTGLIFTVGGTNGLDNKDQFSYENGFSVALGVPANAPDDASVIKSYGVCHLASDSACRNVAQEMVLPLNRQIPVFRVGTVKYPIRVSFTDTDDNVYSFTVRQPFAACQNSSGAGAACAPANRTEIIRDLDCIVTKSTDQTKHEGSDSWCQSANPNRQQKDQMVSNMLSFTVPVNL